MDVPNDHTGGLAGLRDLDIKIVTDNWGQFIASATTVLQEKAGFRTCGMLSGAPGEHFFCLSERVQLHLPFCAYAKRDVLEAVR